MFQNENISELYTLQSQNLSDWGPKRDPLFIVIPFTALFATIFLTGLIGNVSTCIVIARNKSMHTATNYYLFSLAISDLLLLISGLPQEMYFIWSKYPYVFGEIFCVLQGFAAETSANATVLTITAFTAERYIAICHPFLSQTMSKLSRAIKLVIMIWIFAVCLAVPQAMSFGIVYEKLSNGSSLDDDHCICNVKRIVIPHAFLISTVVFFVAPMSLITVLYILIGLRLRQSTVGPVRGGSIKLNHLVRRRSSRIICTGNTNQTALLMNDTEIANLQLSPQEEEDRRKCLNQTQAASQHVVKMLVAVVVAFFICWAPFHAQRLLAIYGQSDSSDIVATTFSALTYISGVLYYLSTTINPVLYHIMSHKFRMAFKETYAACLPKQRQNGIPLHYSNLSRRSSQNGSRSNRSGERNLFETKMAQFQTKHIKRKRRICKNGKNVVYLNTGVIKTPPEPHDSEYMQLVQNSDSHLNEKNNRLNAALNLFESMKAEVALSQDNCKKLEEIEIFHQEQLTIKTMGKIRTATYSTHEKFKNNGCKRRTNSCKIKISNNVININNILKKSATMPNIRFGSYITLHLENDREKHINDNVLERTINISSCNQKHLSAQKCFNSKVDNELIAGLASL